MPSRPSSALIIDDEAHVRAFMRLLLRELGITEVWETGSGSTGVEMALQYKPDVVLLDVNMPQMNGLQVLTKLRELEPNIAVVMITSQGALSTVSEAVRLGAVGYLLKHSPKEQTLKALSETLDALAEEVEGDETS